MKKLLICVSALFMAASAYAGDNGGGTLSCSSSSGRTKVSGAAGAPSSNGEGAASLIYEIDGKKIALDPSLSLSNSDGQVMLVDFATFTAKKSYSVQFKRAANSLIDGKTYVYNLPIFTLTSVGPLKEVSNDVYKFKAVVSKYSVDPRQSTDLSQNELHTFDQDIAVNCTLDVTL